ncbi:MAG: penicillin-binding protein 1C [Calditrichia bacterium]
MPFFKSDYSTMVLDSKGAPLRIFLNSEEQWILPPEPQLPVSPKLQQAVLAFEDKRFMQHRGIDPLAILRAARQNLKAGRIVSGASTLTMQVARLRQKNPRTFFNKAKEMLLALRLECHYSKKEILRLYLDHAPFGGNIIGFRTAAWRYFGKKESELTWGEAAALAVLPNAPGRIAPTRNAPALLQKRNALLQRLFLKGVINKEDLLQAKKEPLPHSEIAFPQDAPHLARLLKNRHPGEPLLHTTINRTLQRAALELLQRHVENLRASGIRNAAALVVETASGKVRAYVGSQDFFDQSRQGMVDGVQAPRSSGSILKPFLYALCMDEGLILPQTQIFDIPSYYGTFSPANADLSFRGVVPAEQALIQSLNVPAVRLLNAYGVYPFFLFLQKAGISSLFRTPDDYGLPLILGGAETRLYDLAALYRGLGRLGNFAPVSLLETSPEKTERRLLSPGAAFLTLSILQNLRRPGSEYYWQQYRNQWPLAWKTGTSYGQRDAWAAGVSPQWTIVVWVGNFDGEPNSRLSGAESAAPLLFDIFNYLPKDPKQSWFTAPDKYLKSVDLCAATGFSAGPFCPETVESEAPLNMKPLRTCPYHKQIFISNTANRQVCSRCWTAAQYHTESYLVYPPQVISRLRRLGHILNEMPAHTSNCPARPPEEAIEIVYPTPRAHIWIPRDVDGMLQKVTLRAAHREPQQLLFWYMDNHFLGKTSTEHVQAATLAAGWHKLEVVDESGNRAQSRFFIARRF